MKKKIIAGVLALSVFFMTATAWAGFAGGGAFGSIWQQLKVCATNIIPSVDNTYTLGSAIKRFSAIYATSTEFVSLTLGSATVDCGTLTMIKGAQTSDPQFSIYLSADANGDTTLAVDSGNLLLSTVSTGLVNFTNGNTIYLGIGADIEAEIAAATAGDTIVLAAGTYTITDDIDIAQAINVVGQGVGQTTVSCTANSKNVFHITASDVRIANMSVVNTGAIPFIVNTGNNLDGLFFEDLDITVGSSSVTTGMYILGSNATLRNVNMAATSSNAAVYAIEIENTFATTQNSIVNMYNVRVNSDGTTNNSYALWIKNTNNANTITGNLYDCVGISSNAGAADAAFLVSSTTTNNAIGNAYNCTFDGNDYDVQQTSTNTLTLYDTTLVNNTTSGTITYGGTVATSGIQGGTELAINDAGLDSDFRIEALGQPSALFLRGSDGNISIGTGTPSSLLDLEKAGTAKANLDILELTNSGNAADMDATETSILFNQWYYDATTPAVANAGRITVGTETDWTSAVAVQDSYMAFSTVLDGVVTEHARINSAGNLGIGTTSPTAILNIDGNSGSTIGLEISNLGTATIGIDLSGGGLSGQTNYFMYNSATNYWRADGLLKTAGNLQSGQALIGSANPIRITGDGYKAQIGAGSEIISFVDRQQQGKNFSIPTQTNPTLRIYSTTDPATSTIEWGSLSFIGTGAGGGYFNIANGVGDIVLQPTGNVSIGATTPNAVALLDVSSTTKGFLPPRMTTVQRDAIATPPAGLMIYNNTTNKLNFYNGTAWEAVTSA